MHLKAKNRTRDAFILLGSTLSVLAGAAISPSLPGMSRHFANVPDIEFLSKLMLAVPPLFIALFSPFAGYLIERTGRKVVITLSIILFGISGCAGYFIDNPYFLLLSRAFVGITVSGIMTGFIVLIGDLFQSDKRSRFMGVQGGLMSASGVVYLLVGGILAEKKWNLPFLIFGFAFFILFVILVSIRRTKNLAGNNNNLEKIKFNSNLIRIYLMAFLVMVLFLMVPTQLPFLLAKNGIQPSMVGLTLAIWILCSSIASMFYKVYRQKFSIGSIYTIGFIIWFIGYIGISLSYSFWMINLSLIFAGFGNGMIQPNLKIELLDYAPEHGRGRLTGFLTTSLYAGQFLSPIILEPFIRLIGLNHTFLLASFFIFLLVITVTFLYKKKFHYHS